MERFEERSDKVSTPLHFTLYTLHRGSAAILPLTCHLSPSEPDRDFIGTSSEPDRNLTEGQPRDDREMTERSPKEKRSDIVPLRLRRAKCYRALAAKKSEA